MVLSEQRSERPSLSLSGSLWAAQNMVMLPSGVLRLVLLTTRSFALMTQITSSNTGSNKEAIATALATVNFRHGKMTWMVLISL